MNAIFTKVIIAASLLIATSSYANDITINLVQGANTKSYSIGSKQAQGTVDWITELPDTMNAGNSQTGSFYSSSGNGVFNLSVSYLINDGSTEGYTLNISMTNEKCGVDSEFSTGSNSYTGKADFSSGGVDLAKCIVTITSIVPQPVTKAIVNIHNQTQ